MPLPPELTEAGVQDRLRIAPDVNPALTIGNPKELSEPSEIPAPNQTSKHESSAFTLADAIVFAQHHSPRLRTARAAIERASGKEQAAFAPFIPEISLGSQNGVTTYNEGPGAPGPTGFILSGPVTGRHSYYQETLQLIWTL